MTERSHWETVYQIKDAADVSWFQEEPLTSLRLLASLGLSSSDPIVDMGGGASRFVDCLLGQGYSDLTVVDLAQAALDQSRTRLNARSDSVSWICADARNWTPPTQYRLWHDRAAFHFFTTKEDRAAYVARLKSGLQTGGFVILASFDLDGPEKCSGLPVMRYSPDRLRAVLGAEFVLKDCVQETHHTPWGSRQAFQYSLFQYLP